VKAISLTQPWATLVSIGAKELETRSWKTTYRGPLAIHAAQKLPAVWGPITRPSFVSHLKAITGINRYGAPDLNRLPRGVILATCRLADVAPIVEIEGWPHVDHLNGATSAIREEEEPFGDYTEGRYAWLLKDVVALPEPIPAKGALRLWEWEERAA
jgi:hypothetical protein